MCTGINVCMYVCTYICICTHTPKHTRVHTYAHMRICTHTHAHRSMSYLFLFPPCLVAARCARLVARGWVQ